MHGENLTSISRIDLPTLVDECLSTESCSAFQPAPPVLRPELTVQPHGTVGRPLPDKPVSTTESHFLPIVECEGRSVEAGPEDGGDTDLEKCRGLTRKIPRVAYPAYATSIMETHSPRRKIQRGSQIRACVRQVVGLTDLTEGE